MKPEAYHKATPIIKGIEAYASQIIALKMATNIKVTIGTTEIGINVSTVGDQGVSLVRAAVTEALTLRSKELENELEKI